MVARSTGHRLYGSHIYEDASEQPGASGISSTGRRSEKVGFIWDMNAGGLSQAIRQARLKEIVCSINADCPSGYVCVNEKCVLAT